MLRGGAWKDMFVVVLVHWGFMLLWTIGMPLKAFFSTFSQSPVMFPFSGAWVNVPVL